MVEFWFEFASTYSYPAALRIEEAAARRGQSIAWRPFLLGPIFREQGWSDSPFNIYPAKGRYMWRDLERLCAGYDIALRRPSQFPRNGLIAARVVCAADGAPWVPAFVRNVYRANFADDLDISQPDVLRGCLEGVAPDADAALLSAGGDAAKAQLRRNVERAVELGIFGAPSFIVDGELFWGNDRLEAALDWNASKGS